jgi:SAM-dependent methyltransferase
MAAGNRYAMADVDAETESGRLGLLEVSRDPSTIRRLQALGVAAGWRCLEVGAGRGSIARWLAERVGEDGSVVAVDIDPRFLADMPENVEVRTLDVREDGLELGQYDLVHCRALLMHLPDPAGALARLASALAPGGLLLAEEGDFGLAHLSGHPSADAVNAITRRTLEAVTEAGIFNAWFGRSLPGMLPAAGLEPRGHEIESAIGSPGEPVYEFARISALESIPGLLAAGVIEDADVDLLEACYAHPAALVVGGTMVAAWAQKPA